jgi:spoIIIJ-associated protein
MEWVETTGKTVAQALDAALDELGVDEDDVEYEVIEEAKGGMFGRRDARVRARVKPLSREKPGERRRRETRRKGARTGGRSGGGSGGARSNVGGSNGGGGSSRPAGEQGGEGGGPRRRRRGGRGRGGGARRSGERSRDGGRTTEDGVSESDVSVEDQAQAAEEFTRGLVVAFGAADAAVDARIEDDGVLVDVTGSDLGLLVGQKGATLQAIEELVRTVVQRRTEGHGARINVDVAGYRAKRREALQRFVQELADKVRETGRDQALEPMTASDRKIVHDAVAELEGVGTVSEGEDPRRRVVLKRA